MKRALIILTAGLLLIAAMASANPGHRGGGMDKPGYGMRHHQDGMNRGAGVILRVADEIGLSDAQKAKITSMMKEFGMDRIDMKAELDKAQLELKHMRLNEASEADVLAQMDKVGELRTELRKAGYSHRQAVKNVLTDEQLDKLDELRQERREGRANKSRGDGHGKRMNKTPGQGNGPRADMNQDCLRW